MKKAKYGAHCAWVCNRRVNGIKCNKGKPSVRNFWKQPVVYSRISPDTLVFCAPFVQKNILKKNTTLSSKNNNHWEMVSVLQGNLHYLVLESSKYSEIRWVYGR